MNADDVAVTADDLARERFGGPYDGRGAYVALVRAGVEGLLVDEAAKRYFGISRRTLDSRCADAGLASPGAIMAWGKALAGYLRYDPPGVQLNDAALGLFSSAQALSAAIDRVTGFRPSARPSLEELFEGWVERERWTGEAPEDVELVVPLHRNGSNRLRRPARDPASPEALARRFKLTDEEWRACHEAARWVEAFVEARLESGRAGTWTDPTADTVISRLRLPIRRHCQLLQVALEIAKREGVNITDLQNKHMGKTDRRSA